MCEFCTAHGEGKKWYLQMKNYANDAITLIPREKRPAAANLWLKG